MRSSGGVTWAGNGEGLVFGTHTLGWAETHVPSRLPSWPGPFPLASPAPPCRPPPPPHRRRPGGWTVGPPSPAPGPAPGPRLTLLCRRAGWTVMDGKSASSPWGARRLGRGRGRAFLGFPLLACPQSHQEGCHLHRGPSHLHRGPGRPHRGHPPCRPVRRPPPSLARWGLLPTTWWCISKGARPPPPAPSPAGRPLTDFPRGSLFPPVPSTTGVPCASRALGTETRLGSPPASRAKTPRSGTLARGRPRAGRQSLWPRFGPVGRAHVPVGPPPAVWPGAAP